MIGRQDLSEKLRGAPLRDAPTFLSDAGKPSPTTTFLVGTAGFEPATP